jgi:hypothetical protein
MFKYSHKMLPEALTPLFTRTNTIHNYNTRNSNKLRTPRIKTYIAEKFITNSGVKIWNTMSEIITPNQKIGAFKHNLVTNLIEKYT